MILRKLSLLAAPLLLAATAHAQLSVYGTVTAESMHNISYTSANSTNTNAQINPIGASFGGFYDFKSFGPVRFGADVRGVILRNNRGADSTADGAGSRINSVLGGVRASFRTHWSALHPYVEGAVGYGRTNYGIVSPNTYPPNVSNPVLQYGSLYSGIEYHGFVGLDARIAPLISIRIFELGAGAFNSSNPISRTYPLESVSTGLVFHLPF